MDNKEKVDYIDSPSLSLIDKTLVLLDELLGTSPSLLSEEERDRIEDFRWALTFLFSNLWEKYKNSSSSKKGETNMNTKDLKQYKEVLNELETEMNILKEDIWTISYHIERSTKQFSHVKNSYNFLRNIYTTIKLEDKENEDNKNNS